MITRIRERPQEFDADCWDGTTESAFELSFWVNRRATQVEGDPLRFIVTDGVAHTMTLNGEKVCKGYFIVAKLPELGAEPTYSVWHPLDFGRHFEGV